jgi:hypothetical protein
MNLGLLAAETTQELLGFATCPSCRTTDATMTYDALGKAATGHVHDAVRSGAPPSGHDCRVRRVGVGSDGSRTEHVMAHEITSLIPRGRRFSAVFLTLFVLATQNEMTQDADRRAHWSM